MGGAVSEYGELLRWGKEFVGGKCNWRGISEDELVRLWSVINEDGCILNAVSNLLH